MKKGEYFEIPYERKLPLVKNVYEYLKKLNNPTPSEKKLLKELIKYEKLTCYK